MNEFVQNNESLIRLSFFLGVFFIMALWEIKAPRRVLTLSKPVRWVNNLGLVVLNTVLLRLLFPMAGVGMAAFAASNGWGMFNHFEVPFVVALLVSVILLDMAIYLQHVMFHAVPILWRLHRVHHVDLDIDVTTGARFHPIEIILSMGIKFAVICVLGTPLVAVIIFEILLNATAMFNHSNVRLPIPLDRLIRLLFVTPDMHRVHHSTEIDETNSNFGFNLSIWDRFMGTYRAQPRLGHEGMTIGITTFTKPSQCAWLPGMLALPFVRTIGDYAINRSGNRAGNRTGNRSGREEKSND